MSGLQGDSGYTNHLDTKASNARSMYGAIPQADLPGANVAAAYSPMFGFPVHFVGRMRNIHKAPAAAPAIPDARDVTPRKEYANAQDLNALQVTAPAKRMNHFPDQGPLGRVILPEVAPEPEDLPPLTPIAKAVDPVPEPVEPAEEAPTEEVQEQPKFSEAELDIDPA